MTHVALKLAQSKITLSHQMIRLAGSQLTTPDMPKLDWPDDACYGSAQDESPHC